MTSPTRPVTALDLARDRQTFDLDAVPIRWPPGPPFDALDLRPGRIVLIGAPPGSGKTTLALQVVCDVVTRHSLRAVIANVETAPPVLVEKTLARLAPVDVTALMNRTLTADERQRIDAAIHTHADTLDRLAFHTGPFTSPALFQAMVTADARVCVVDYVQRFTAHPDDDRAKLDAIMNQLRTLADQGTAVLAISSVARQRDPRGSSSYSGLSLAAFRGSSELEFGCDSAYLLHTKRDSGIAQLQCVKNRFGPEQHVPLRFFGAYQRFDTGDPLDLYDAASGRRKGHDA